MMLQHILYSLIVASYEIHLLHENHSNMDDAALKIASDSKTATVLVCLSCLDIKLMVNQNLVCELC